MNRFHLSKELFSEGTVAKQNCTFSSDEEGLVVLGTNHKSFAIWQQLMKLYSHFTYPIIKAGYTNDLSELQSLFNQDACSLILSADTYSADQLDNDAPLSVISNWIDTSLIKDKDLDALSLIGIQKHLCQESVFHQCMDSMFNLLRLSDLYRDINLCEVVLRESEHVVFDLAVIRKSDFTIEQKNASICGITLDQACQLMKFIGSIQTLKTIEITSIDYSHSEDHSYYELISILIWYFMEGTNFKSQDSSISHKKQYIVYPEGIELPLYFYNESMTDKWWVNTTDDMEQLVACSPNDFNDVKKGILSERMIKIVDMLS